MEIKIPFFPLKEIGRIVKREIKLEPNGEYKTVGCKLYGLGVYERETKGGSDIQAKRMFLIEENDFLINRIWAQKGSAGIVPPELEGSVVTNDFPVIELDLTRVYPPYLSWYVKTRKFWETCRKHSRGTSGRERLSPKELPNIEIPLPSFEEQKRIVATIGSLMARIEEARRLRAEAVEEVEETVENTHNLIFLKLSQNFGTVQIQQTELDINPENINPKREFGEKSFIYIDVSSVEQNTGKIVEKKNIIGVDAPSRARRKMHKNDVIFSAVRPNLRKCFVVDEKLDGNVCSTGFTTFRIRNNKIEPTFLKYQLLSNFFINQCMNVVTGGHYPAINDKNMRNLEVTFPPLSEQRRIVTYLDLLQAKVDELKRLHAETEKEIEELAPSILDKAFKGEL